jgi:hypothetical protein
VDLCHVRSNSRLVALLADHLLLKWRLAFTTVWRSENDAFVEKNRLAGHRERVRRLCCLLLMRAAERPRNYLIHMDRNPVCGAIVIAG